VVKVSSGQIPHQRDIPAIIAVYEGLYSKVKLSLRLTKHYAMKT
jgi:hypothetical protein